MRVCQFRHFGLETFIPLGVRLWNSSRTAVGRAAYILSPLRDLPVNVRSLVGDARRGGCLCQTKG